MIKEFIVVIHYADGSKNKRHVFVQDDILARAKAIEIEEDSVKLTKNYATMKSPIIDYCEILLTAETEKYEEQLPKLGELKGIAPDATGKLSSEEFIGNLRSSGEQKGLEEK